MKKITLLFALLCASVMGWAADYCNTAMTSRDGNSATVTMRLVSETTYEFSITTAKNIVSYNAAGSNFYANKDGVGGYHVSEHLTQVGNTLSVQFTSSSTPSIYANALFIVLEGHGEDLFNIPTDASWASCSSKPSPELSLNASKKTLEIDATAETFQIVATKATGSGALSYSSNAEGVATVSNDGLITAVGNGTATITVSVAENASYAAESKTITVEVIDWPNIGWLQNSNDSYKLHISPAMGGDGQRIEGSNLWIGFPSAVFGDMSIEQSGGAGAWKTFALSNFPGRRSQFTVVCQGTTHTFTVYRKFDGVNLAKGMPSYAGRDNANAWQSNDNNKGSRWGSAGAQHYAAVGDAAEDWWYVDLGAVYSVEKIKILFETACPWDFDILTSPNGTSWVERGTYAEPAHKGNSEADYNEYTLSPAKHARYVKVFTRSGYNNLDYGFSMWEFEVYGQPAENVDVNAPVLTSAAVSGTPTTNEIKIAVSATDAEDAAITRFHVVEPTLGYNRNMTAVEGKLTFSGLSDNSDYSFTITALDDIGNQSNAIVVNASTADDPLNPATLAPEPPARSADDVRAIYSDAYTDILMHEFIPERTDWGSVAATRRVKDGNHYLLYDISSGNNITWGSNDDGANAIVAKADYRATGTGLDASGMEYLHIDIWCNEVLTNINVKIGDAVFTTITHDGSGWKSYNLPLAGSSVDFTNIRWIKLDGITSDVERHRLAVDNYYFWKAPSGVKAVNVSTNNDLWGSATAKVGDDEVTSVTTDTEVTFSATPVSGYDFAYWTIGDAKVYTNPYTVAITSNTNAVATFEPTRSAYCAVPVTNAANHTIYLTVKKTNNANEYMILFEGSSNTHITGSHGNIQFRLTHVNGETGEYHFDETKWTVDATGFGSIYTTFTAEDFRAITITNRYIPLTTSNSAADEFNFPTNDATLIKWDATCADDEAPVLATPTATSLSGTSVRLAMSATDNMAALLTYYIDYEGLATPIEVQGTSGETTYTNIKGLTSGTKYTFSVTVSDGINTSTAKTCSATPTMPMAPVPTHNAALVRSVYSDTYESALAHDFIKNNWSWITYTEQSVGGNNFLVYTSDPAAQAQMPDVAWGTDNNGETAIIAKDGYNDGTNQGLDVRKMQFIHFDIWSAVATNYPELRLNDTYAGAFQLNGSGWQSFDIDITGLTDEQKTNIRWIKFIALRTPNPEEIAIDNVYFWSYGVTTNQDKWSTFACAEDMQVSSGITAYKAVYSKNDNEEILTLTELNDGIIPANEGVILKSDVAETTHIFLPASATPSTDMSDNSLTGCVTRTDVSSVRATKDIFCMRRSDLYDQTGFFLYEGQYVPAGKAYLALPKDPSTPSSAPRHVRFVFNKATDVENVQGDNVQNVKFVENGQMFIRRGDAIYTIQGVRVK